MKKRVIEACKIGAVLTGMVLLMFVAIAIPVAVIALIKNIWILAASLIVLFFIYTSIYYFFVED